MRREIVLREGRLHLRVADPVRAEAELERVRARECS